MRVLVVGSGAREHALAGAWPGRGRRARVVVAPGNPGMADVARGRVPMSAFDRSRAARRLALVEREVDLVVVGPEAAAGGRPGRPACARRVSPSFGPGRAAARLEGSKAFCREVAERRASRWRDGPAFDDAGAAIDVRAHARRTGRGQGRRARRRQGRDGLRRRSPRRRRPSASCRAAGSARPASGSWSRRRSRARGERHRALRRTALLALPAARDHKRLGDGDTGPQHRRHGRLSRPCRDLDDADVGRAGASRSTGRSWPSWRGAASPFRGALFAGLMLTADGPRLLEFNVRFGDPGDAGASCPASRRPLAPLLHAAATGRLAEAAASSSASRVDAAVRSCRRRRSGVVARGGRISRRRRARATAIDGLDAAARDRARWCSARAFVARRRAALETAGGRVLTVVGRGPDARARRRPPTTSRARRRGRSSPGMQRAPRHRPDAPVVARRSVRRDRRATRCPRWARSGRDQARFEQMLRVELAVLRALRRAGIGAGARRSRPSRRAPASTSTASPSSSGPPTTTSSPSSARSPRPSGEEGRWLHFGLTSSDVVDTALALQCRDARTSCSTRDWTRSSRCSPPVRASTPGR